MSCRADASFRPKLTTARIASARQKIKKNVNCSTIFLVKKMVCTYVRTCTEDRLVVRLVAKLGVKLG